MGDLLSHYADSRSGMPVRFVRVELTRTGAPAFGDFLVVRWGVLKSLIPPTHRTPTP